ncbi:MAG: HAD family phosphatase [Candidatus Andeanibacterium colombiense]|uniref:HAD family phosphatase n=1 Tax=Candidatus Andeanibacterium colombiense TaxID=3121345 RepID=A0AAJ5X4R6_9SPHN|nr:MAG: HAD family phosphatase [Sphingomonadaceae bacterium]
MPEVSAVVFDVGRVIVQWDMRRLLRKVIADPDELEFVAREVVTEQWHFRHDAGEELAALVAERKAQFPEHAAAIDAYATRFNETIPGLVPGTPALVDRLARRGVPLYAITNFAAPFWDAYRPTEPLFRHFRDVVVSGAEKIAKPDPAIYHLAERRFGHAAEAMLFIDDNPANIEAAAALGWQVHLFTDAERLEADLAARGLI